MKNGFDFGRRMEWLLRENEMSVSELAEAINVDERYVRHYVFDALVPSDEVGKKIAKLFNVSFTFLMTGVDEGMTFDMVYSMVRKHCDEWDDTQKNKMVKKLLKGSRAVYEWNKK